MPFFCLQVFDFCVNCLTVVGYFSYIPNMKAWIAAQVTFCLLVLLFSNLASLKDLPERWALFYMCTWLLLSVCPSSAQSAIPWGTAGGEQWLADVVGCVLCGSDTDNQGRGLNVVASVPPNPIVCGLGFLLSTLQSYQIHQNPTVKGQNESFLYFSICSCSNIVNYALDNFAGFEKRNRAVNDSN